MQKILCLIDTLGMGGAERQMIGLSLLLKNKGYDVDLVTYYDHDFYADLLRGKGIEHICLKTNNRRLSKIQAVYNCIQRGGYNWVIAYKDGPALISCLLKLIGCKFRLIVSERNTNQNISGKDRLKFNLYRLAEHIVPNSHSQERFIRNHFPNLSKKIITITNFTDTNYFCPAKENNNDYLNVTTVARIAIQKNLLNYFAAIKLLKDNGYEGRIHFNWYGDVQQGEERYGELCCTRIVELGIGNMIDMHPATSDIVVPYQNCDVFCLPSLYEGFPNVICEAMSCGKPIVCSNVCDNPDIVQCDVNGILFDPKDVSSIYQALKSIIDVTAERRRTWGKNSRKIAESLFSQETFVQKYIKLLEQND